MWCYALCNCCRITFWEKQDGGLSCSYLCTNITILNKCTHISLTPLHYNIVLRHMSALTGPYSRNTTDTFQQQDQKNALLDAKFNLASSVIYYAVVIWLTQQPRNMTQCSLRWILHFCGLKCIRHKEWVNAYWKLYGHTNKQTKPFTMCYVRRHDLIIPPQYLSI